MIARYEIIEEAAGEGGYGRIDKAWDNELERNVAIKTLDPLFKASPSAEDKERFKREAKILHIQTSLQFNTAIIYTLSSIYKSRFLMVS